MQKVLYVWEFLMKGAQKMLLSAGLLTVGAGVGHSFADDHEVNNVWWGLISGYNGSHQTACVAENYNNNPVDAVFDLFPARFDFKGNPAPGRVFISMRPTSNTKFIAGRKVSASPRSVSCGFIPCRFLKYFIARRELRA